MITLLVVIDEPCLIEKGILNSSIYDITELESYQGCVWFCFIRYAAIETVEFWEFLLIEIISIDLKS